MIPLYFFGQFVEVTMSSGHLADLYFLGALTGGISGFYFDIIRRNVTYLIGASGATCSILSYFIVKHPNHPLYLFGLIELPAWVVGVLMIVQSTTGIGSMGNVSHSGHLAGLLTGVAYYYYTTYKKKSK